MRHLTSQDLAERLGNIHVKTLGNWRRDGTGPKFIKAGGRILYPIEEVEAFEKSRMYKKISQYTCAGSIREHT
jgi:hypothetical protein